MDEKTLERFWSKVNKDGPVPEHRPELGKCWVWTAGPRSGYGTFWFRGGRISAHRFSMALLGHQSLFVPQSGPGATGDCVCHHCDNPRCVRPSHLFLGSHLENMNDMDEKGRRILSVGEAHGHAKLRASDVVEIVRLWNAGLRTSELADRFGVSPSVISNVCTGRRWKNVERAARVEHDRHYRGELCHTAKLTEDLVREVRRRCDSGESRRAIAEELGLDRSSVARIARRETWRHVA